jgi:predicted nucleotidyltransferase
MMPVDLAAHARTMMERALAEESAKRSHLVVSLSGAHAYGFPSPDSDLDLKSIHVERTARLLGLGNATLHADRMEVIEGVEIDYTSNEIRPVLLGVLHGNGNYIERILGRTPVMEAPELEALKPLAAQALSRRLGGHYLGFAQSQREAFTRESTVKKLLYVLRTALTGTHALRTGEIVTDLGELCDPYGFGGARDLIVAKRRGELVKLEPAETAHWLAEADRTIGTLRAAIGDSPLPPDAPEGASHALEDWLLQLRRQSWEG